MARLAIVSFRLGLTDGVSIEAEKWTNALTSLGHEVVTVAGEGRVDHVIPGLAIDAADDPDVDLLRRTLEDVDLVIVENLASLPLNLDARDALYEVRADRAAIFRHHDLPWQRPHLQHLEGPAHLGPWAHVTINDRSRVELLQRGIVATTIPNHFLNAGRYHLSIIIGKDQKHVLLKADEPIAFDIENTTTGRGKNNSIAPGDRKTHV